MQNVFKNAMKTGKQTTDSTKSQTWKFYLLVHVSDSCSSDSK